MLSRTLSLFAIILSLHSYAQTGIKTDTVQRGYYIPLDSNVVSYQLGIKPMGGKLTVKSMQGNKLSDSTINVISHLEPNSLIIYSEITVMNKGVLEKAPTVRYIVGNKSTRLVKRDPTYPDTLTAKEIGSMVLDRHVYSFTVSWILNGNMYMYDLTGNGVFGNAQTAIEALPSGTKVYFESIRREEDDGSKRIMPTEIHIVR